MQAQYSTPTILVNCPIFFAIPTFCGFLLCKNLLRFASKNYFSRLLFSVILARCPCFFVLCFAFSFNFAFWFSITLNKQQQLSGPRLHSSRFGHLSCPATGSSKLFQTFSSSSIFSCKLKESLRIATLLTVKNQMKRMSKNGFLR